MSNAGGNRYSQHSFAQIPRVNMARSKFDRSFTVKDTMNFDYLVPIFVDEVLPGDTINLNVKSFHRLAPQVVPLMDNMYLDYFFFFVPNRLVWNNWEKFNGAQDEPDDSTDFLVPTLKTTAVTGEAVGSLSDKFGIPTGVPDLEVNALPYRAYYLIWNEWFRDQNLQNKLPVQKGDSGDVISDYVLLKRAKKHDYFTSALPWPQKGDSIQLPLGAKAPVYGETLTTLSGIGQHAWQAVDNANREAAPLNIDSVGSVTYLGTTPKHSMALGAKEDYSYENALRPPYADLSEATAATINQFRQAIMMQSLLELDARGGTRYVEILRAHFNVVSPDFRLQRPEFLSGGTTYISQHVVAQTSETTEDGTPQGNLAAFSTAVNSSNHIGFTKSFVEHGYVIGLVQARADVTYQQGLNKMWTRQTRWDFFWPKLQELGEQAILNKEIYAQGTSDDDDVFGYQERYAEYRYKPSEIRGQFRSTYSETLDVWHLAEEFDSLPALNSTFIQSVTPIERSLVVPDPTYPALLADYWFQYKHARPMMTYGVPATLGRF